MLMLCCLYYIYTILGINTVICMEYLKAEFLFSEINLLTKNIHGKIFKTEHRSKTNTFLP